MTNFLLWHFCLVMSGLSKKKYKRLTGRQNIDHGNVSSSSSSSMEEFSLELPSEEIATHSRLTSDLTPPLEVYNSPRHSVEQLIPSSSNSNILRNSTSLHLSSQFDQVLRNIDSSQSSSWFTASSQMGENDLMTKSADLSGANANAQNISSTAVQRSLSAIKHPQSFSGLSSVLVLDDKSQPGFFRMNSGGSSNSSHDVESGRDENYIWTDARQSMVSQDGSVRNLILSTKVSSLHSPSKLLQKKWKQLFLPKRNSNNDTNMCVRSNSSRGPVSSIGEISGTELKELELSHMDSPTFVPFRFGQSVGHHERTEPRRRSESSHQSQSLSAEQRRKMMCVRSSLPALRHVRRSLGESSQSQDPQQSNSQVNIDGSQSSVSNNNELVSGIHIADEYKSSFEREEESSDNLLEREAHIGALALAWATGTRKPRNKLTRLPSEHGTELKTSPSHTAMAAKADLSQLNEECTGTISSQILGNVSWKSYPGRGRTRFRAAKDEGIGFDLPPRPASVVLRAIIPSPLRAAFIPLNIRPRCFPSKPTDIDEDAAENPEEKRDRLTGTIADQDAPQMETSVKSSRPGFFRSKLFPQFYRKPSVKLRETSSHAELSESSQSVDDKSRASYSRAAIRRGAQDIPPLCTTGGPLTSAQQPLLQKAQTHGIGWRLSTRKSLNERRGKIADYSFFLAVIGILLMVIDLELLMANVYARTSFYSLLMKSLITASTFILVGLIIFYHAVDIQLFSVNNCIEDWRIATNYRRLGSVMLEVLICLIHPPPIISNLYWPFFKSTPFNAQKMSTTHFQTPSSVSTSHDSSNYTIAFTTTTTTPMVVKSNFDHMEEFRSEFVSLELTLAIPMFLRLYLIFRVLLLHSTFFTDAGSRSIGALNRVKINVRFVLKTLATAQPGTMLLIFILSMWVITSWIMRVCERQLNPEYEKMFNTMWLIAVTFLSIGYGDMVPNTHCGRSISVIAGVMGSACTALVVAVVARKLELSRAEKHVHNFMQDNKVYKQLRHSAANVLRETWLFYKHTRLVKRVNASRVRHHQRKFLTAIRRLRKAKDDQRKLKEDANSMVDLAKLQTSVFDMVSSIRTDQAVFVQRLISIEKAMGQLQLQVNELPEAISDLIRAQSVLNPGTNNLDGESQAVKRAPVSSEQT